MQPLIDAIRLRRTGFLRVWFIYSLLQLVIMGLYFTQCFLPWSVKTRNKVISLFSNHGRPDHWKYQRRWDYYEPNKAWQKLPGWGNWWKSVGRYERLSRGYPITSQALLTLSSSYARRSNPTLFLMTFYLFSTFIPRLFTVLEVSD